jgi:hypothetical protein
MSLCFSCSVYKNNHIYTKAFEQYPTDVLLSVELLIEDVSSNNSVKTTFFVKFFDSTLFHYYYKDTNMEVLINRDILYDIKNNQYFSKKTGTFQSVNGNVNTLRNVRPNAHFKWQKTKETTFENHYFRDHQYSLDSMSWRLHLDSIFISSFTSLKQYYLIQNVTIKITPIYKLMDYKSELLKNDVKNNNLEKVVKSDDAAIANCDTLFPLNSLKDYIAYEIPAKMVLLYSYIGCVPCQKLIKDLKTQINYHQMNADLIRIVNVKDNEIAKEEYRKNQNIPFPYLNVDSTCSSGGFPKIGAYVNGDLKWIKEGYNKTVVSEIIYFLNTK